MTWATISIDLGEIDTDDLIREMEQRDKSAPAPVEASQIFEAFYLGDESAALRLTRQYVQDVTGRVLP